VLVGALKLRKAVGRGVFRAALRGYLDGRRAVWLPGQDWENLLSRPLDSVRRELGISDPVAYQSVRQLVTA
jgi:ubiquinone biosynthesis protein COQ4